MSREIRRVPPGWQHPRQRCTHSPWLGGCEDGRRNGGRCFHPMHDESFEEAMEKYEKERLGWAAGNRPDWVSADTTFEDYRDRPSEDDRAYYRPRWTPEEATAYQLYEGVSEGTPVSPVFKTIDELVAYLADYGDFWDQHPNSFNGAPPRGGWGRENAEAFVRGGGWMPSLVVHREGSTVTRLEPKDLFPKPKRGVTFGKL